MITLKHGGGGLKLTVTPADEEATSALNRVGTLRWQLVIAVCVGPGQPILLYLKQSR